MNPVISAKDVTDMPAAFVADPFMLRHENVWHMFFEVLHSQSKKGAIGLATSPDGLIWEYRQIVLSEPFHLSYPYVFHLNGDYFMVPETYQAGSIRLYRADPFPHRWSLVSTLMEGAWVDSSIFFFNNLWWLFTTPMASEHSTLELFSANDVMGPWSRHPMSPLVQNDRRLARPAGRVIANGASPVRFTQDCFPTYGMTVRAFEISHLSTSGYSEREIQPGPILAAGKEAWRESGMHHIDAHAADGRWIACVDGWRSEPEKQT
ncbi:MAG TPA: hypothetical protein VKZ53_05115 [Candidatus Angelobacter sp.]|nr:hypothetical protein [Candidatus Angelobacter sp.]